MRVSWAARLEGADAAEYDAFVLASPAGHVAQTRAWADLATARGNATPSFAIVRDANAVVGTALVLRPRIAGVPLPWARVERGPVTTDIATVAEVTQAIARAARARGVLRMRVMPYWLDADAARVEGGLHANGWRDVQRADGPHACTLRLAIGGKTDDELVAGKSRQQVRWRASQAEKAGARARRGSPADWARLREMHGVLMRSQGRRDTPGRWWDALAGFASDDARGALFACDHEGRTVAAAVILRHGPVATYAWGASVPDRLPFTKAIPALVAGIRWARDVGCTIFDLGGVPLDDDTDPKRAAIATFKYDFDRTRVRLVREHARWC